MNTFFILLLGLPALEIFLMIKIGGKIGALNTIALIFLTAIVGIYFARIQGIATLKSGIINLYRNKTPIYEILSGASIALAAAFLIVPGFFTDLIGFFIDPFTRKILFKTLFIERLTVNTNKKNEKTIDGEIIDKNKDEL